MMKLEAIFGVFLLSLCVHGQSVANAAANDFETLLDSIIPSQERVSDSSKARAIFKWISKEFHYDHLLADTSPSFGQPEIWNKITRNVDTLLLTRKGVCNGISYLYYLLCKKAGLQVIDVLGETKGYSKNGDFFFLMSYPHTWNMVYWNGTWHRIDCTWALASENKDTVDYFWFDTRPEVFILSHYAYDQMLNTKFDWVAKNDFYSLPYFGRDFFKYFQVSYVMVSDYLNGKSNAESLFSKPNENVIPYVQKMKSCFGIFEGSEHALLALSSEIWREVDATRNECVSIAIKVRKVEVSKEDGFEFETKTITTIYDLARVGSLFSRRKGSQRR